MLDKFWRWLFDLSSARIYGPDYWWINVSPRDVEYMQSQELSFRVCRHSPPCKEWRAPDAATERQP